MQSTTIEGSHESGSPSDIVVSTSGSYEYENLDEGAYDAVVGVYVTDNESGEKEMIAVESYAAGGSGGQATFENVSGDVLDAMDKSEFTAENDGDTQNTTVPIEVMVTVCEFELSDGGECVEFSEQHEVTVTVHNTANDDGGGAEEPGSVTGSTELDGYMVFDE